MPEPEPAIWKEPVRGGTPDPTLFGLSGLEQIRSYFNGLAIPPPIHHLTGMRPAEAGPGTAAFTMPATGWLASPPGMLQLGTLAILADGPLGSAIQTTLPAFTGYTTAEISMTYLRPVTAQSGLLTSRGRLVTKGTSLGFSECTIEDGQGRLVAHGTTRCVIFPPMGPPPEQLPEFKEVELPEYGTPDPYLREPVAGEILGQDVWDAMTGLEITRGFIAGELPAPPISHLTGLRPVEADEGTCTFVLPATEWLCSPLGRVEGGMIALLAETATASAIQTTVPAKAAYAPLDLKINFLRPVNPDGRELRGRGEVIHRGRTIAVANSEVTDADGKLVAVARSSAMILPDRPWRPERPFVPADEPVD